MYCFLCHSCSRLRSCCSSLGNICKTRYHAAPIGGAPVVKCVAIVVTVRTAVAPFKAGAGAAPVATYCDCVIVVAACDAGPGAPNAREGGKYTVQTKQFSVADSGATVDARVAKVTTSGKASVSIDPVEASTRTSGRARLGDLCSSGSAVAKH
jgi:hypothetical protein